jgi:hypothetical protein
MKMKKTVFIFTVFYITGLFFGTLTHAQSQPDNTTSSNLLFPCDGVTLGKTTVEELAKLGTRTVRINSRTNQPYNYYIVKGQNVWYSEVSGLAIFYSITHTGVLPEKWILLGMSFENSYNQWIDFAKANNLDILVVKKPQKEIYQDHDTFTAKLELLYTADGFTYAIELDFKYSKGTTTVDNNTLYNISVRVR